MKSQVELYTKKEFHKRRIVREIEIVNRSIYLKIVVPLLIQNGPRCGSK